MTYPSDIDALAQMMDTSHVDLPDLVPMDGEPLQPPTAPPPPPRGPPEAHSMRLRSATEADT